VPLVEDVLGLVHHLGGLASVGDVVVVVLGLLNVDVGDVLASVLVPGRTLGQEVDVGEAIVFDGLRDDLLGLIRVDRGGAGDVARTGGQRQ